MKEINNEGLSDPVDILHFLYKQIIKGWDLDVTSEDKLQERKRITVV